MLPGVPLKANEELRDLTFRPSITDRLPVEWIRLERAVDDPRERGRQIGPGRRDRRMRTLLVTPNPCIRSDSAVRRSAHCATIDSRRSTARDPSSTISTAIPFERSNLYDDRRALAEMMIARMAALEDRPRVAVRARLAPGARLGAILI
jgi:hypothetical protein